MRVCQPPNVDAHINRFAPPTLSSGKRFYALESSQACNDGLRIRQQCSPSTSEPDDDSRHFKLPQCFANRRTGHGEELCQFLFGWKLLAWSQLVVVNQP